MLQILRDYAKLGYEFKFFNCKDCQSLHLIVSKDVYKNGKYVETIGASFSLPEEDHEDIFIKDLGEAFQAMEKIIS